MRPLVITIAVLACVATIAAASAAGNGIVYSGHYVDAYSYHYVTYSPTQFGYSSYGPDSIYQYDSSVIGAYSVYTGKYYDQFTGKQMSQYNPYYGGIPVRYYPQLQVFHYG